MRLANYELAKEVDKIEWLNSIKMSVGLPYFGGKSVIGRYIFNNIFNLSVEMKKKGDKPDIFIDAFSGGGKMALSVPRGWYETIVINDMDYGVYSFYKSCKENYLALIEMIEKIGDFMSKDVFYLAAYIRRFGMGADKWNDGKNDIIDKEEEVLDTIAAGALTYWVTSSAFNNITAPDSTTYNLYRIPRDENGNPLDDNSEGYIENKREEQDNIKRIITKAKKNIPKLHQQLNQMDYRIENLDYRELIKKYNGLEYVNLQGEEQKAEVALKSKNKLWYFDPPYHPLCLYVGEDAPYADTFSEDMANEMVKILAGEETEKYGDIRYFIKSDYDPKYILEVAKRDIDDKSIKQQRRDWYKNILEREKKNHEVSNIFAKLEEYPFCKICVGGFDKGSTQADGKKGTGQEYIWCKGFSEGYADIEGVQAKI